MKISIVVPLYNQQRYILQTLSSILNQSFSLEECEVLLADDCSTDESYELVLHSREWASIVECVRFASVVRHDSNKGLIGNFDYLFNNARGRLILAVAGDDWLEPNCLSVVWNTLGDVDVGMSFTNGWFRFNDGRQKQLYPESLSSGRWYGSDVRPDSVRCYTKSLYELCGLPEFLDSEGVWLISHALAFGECYYDAQCMFNYRVHDDSATAKGYNTTLQSFRRGSIKALHRNKRLVESIRSKGELNRSAICFISEGSISNRAKRISCLNVGVFVRYLLLSRLLKQVVGRRKYLVYMCALGWRWIAFLNLIRWRMTL